MTISSGRTEFLKSEKAKELEKALFEMVESPQYNTHYVYSIVESDGSQFVDKHMRYMSSHPAMDHWQYLANVKLMTKINKK